MEIKTQLLALGKKENANIHEDNVGVDRIAMFLRDHDFATKLKFVFTDDTSNEIINYIDKTCNFFGITLHSENIQFVFELAKAIKLCVPDSIVFVGSIFATFSAEDIINNCDHIDFVVLGHGDIPLKLLYQNIRDNNLTLQESLLQSPYILSKYKKTDVHACYSNINLHLLPEREYLAYNNKTVACIIGSHGCYGRCSFCTVPEPGAKVSERDVNDIFLEIQKLHIENNVSFFYFLDSAIEGFGVRGKDRLNKLCHLIDESEYNLSFRAFIRAESFKNTREDIKLLTLLKKVGFVNIIVGIEAGNDNDLKIYNKLSNIQHINNCLSLFESLNFEIMLGYIILNPYTSFTDLKNNYKLLKKYKYSLLHNYINCLQVNYNTPIYYRLKDDRLLSPAFSFKSNGYEYICKDKDTQIIYEFLKDNFIGTEISQKDFQFHNYITHIYYMLNVIEDSDEIQKEVNNIRTTINSLCKDYFKIIFLDYNLPEARAKLQHFKLDIFNEYNAIESLNNKLLKRYLASII